jgi:transcriptional regulator with XRE-family HTH domain
LRQKKKGVKMADFPTRLKELMLEKKASQQKLANYVGVKRQAVSYWVNARTVPAKDSFQKIAKYFGVSYDYLDGTSENRYYENETLIAELKLKERAIEKIKEWAQADEQPLSEIDMLNEFLKSFFCDDFLKYSLKFSEECKNKSKQKSADESQTDDFYRYKAVKSIECFLNSLVAKGKNK